MIGVNTSIFKSAGRKLVNLLGALKDRAAYYENGTDSTAEKNRIDDLGVLDKATILLTPTATSDARVHSVKTYAGDELVTNGTFDTDLTDWQISSWWTWNALGAYHPPTNSHKPLYQQTCEVGKTYRISFDLNVLQGAAKVSLGTNTGFTSQVFATNLGTGNHVYYIKAEHEYIIFNRHHTSVNNEYYLDNVSIIDVSSDFDFDRASSATRINSSGLVQDMQSITDPELVLNGDFEELGDELITNGSLDTNSGWTFVNGPTYNSNGYIDFNLVGGNARTDINVVQDKVYKVVYEIKNYQEGTIKFRLQGGTNTGGQQQSGNGIKTEYVTCNDSSNNNFQFFGSSSFIGSVDNVSVKQVDPNDRWTLVGDFEIDDTKGFITNASQYSQITSQQGVNFLDNGKTYKLEADITTSIDNALAYRFTGGAVTPISFSDIVDGKYVSYFTMSQDGYFWFQTTGSYTGLNATIDNVSVKDITFSTDVDLARINYDGNGDNGHILLEPTSTNLQDYSENFDEWTHSNGDFTITNELAPDGLTKVYKSTVGGTTGSAHFFTGPPILVVGQKYTASYFFKYVDHPWVRITHISSSTTGVWFNIQNGTIGTENGTSVGKIEDYGNGWYRCSNTFTATQTNSSTNVFGAISDGDGDTDSVANKSVLVWGAQVENLGYPTSYIPVHSTSNVTRAVEKLTGSGNASLIESRQGTFYVDIAALAPSTGTQISISLSGGSSNDRVLIYSGSGGGEWKAQFRKDSSSYVTIEKSATISNQSKVALAWESGRYVMFVDGVKATSYSTGSETESTTFDGGDLTSIQFSPNNGSGSNFFYGKCKALAVFNEALEDDELELLTGVTNYGSFGELASANGYTII